MRQSKVSVLPDLKRSGPLDPNPFSWLSRQIPVAGNIEVSLQAKLDAVVEEPGPLGNSHFGLTLILDRKHFNFMCERNHLGEGRAKLYSFVVEGSPRLEGGETDRRVSLPLALQTGRTFQFKIRLTRLFEGQVQLQAKVWPRGKPEPIVWQLDAIRNAPLAQPLIELDTRRCACTFTEMHVVLISSHGGVPKAKHVRLDDVNFVANHNKFAIWIQSTPACFVGRGYPTGARGNPLDDFQFVRCSFESDGGQIYIDGGDEPLTNFVFENCTFHQPGKPSLIMGKQVAPILFKNVRMNGAVVKNAEDLTRSGFDLSVPTKFAP